MKRSKCPEHELKRAEQVWGPLGSSVIDNLTSLLYTHKLSIVSGDLLYLDNRWYVTHSGLLRLANRKRCAGIQVLPEKAFCNPKVDRWVFKATVFRSATCRGFVGHGDADPSNVSPLVHGAEMRVAETRAVNRALRKAYGIGICSIEEIGTVSRATESVPEPRRLPRQSASGNGNSSPRVRDRLCQLIRQHRLDPDLVKAYATDFCGTKRLKDATRQQVENFVEQLADWVEKDRNALLRQLNSYLPSKEKEGAA